MSIIITKYGEKIFAYDISRHMDKVYFFNVDFQICDMLEVELIENLEEILK